MATAWVRLGRVHITGPNWEELVQIAGVPTTNPPERIEVAWADVRAVNVGVKTALEITSTLAKVPIDLRGNTQVRLEVIYEHVTGYDVWAYGRNPVGGTL
ncbi:Hypp7630 [Branchiostoma lanceolatum]|uniref:Hypp7630 protein n=1 Tax=Branchiostoma lanceolatum TaxID=7740 RepID=A0A8K0EAH7_BRALA|nr:Hypp7630 [Branchiostoma lanceolatum]